MYDVIIIGGGLAATLSAAAAAKNQLKTLLVGQVFDSLPKDLAGSFLDMEKIFAQLKAFKNLEVLNTSPVAVLEKNIVSFSLELKNGSIHYANAVILATQGQVVDFEHLTQKTSGGKVKVDSCQRTSVPGIWAIGESTWQESFGFDVLFGEAFKAAESILHAKLNR